MRGRTPTFSLAGESPETMAEMGESALEQEDFARALALFDRAERAGAEPDRCAGGRWMACMLAGDFERAWRESDAIRLRGGPDPHRFWNGEDFGGKRVVLRSLHGFGDAVQMFRFLPRLRGMVSELTVEVPPSLLALAPCFAGMGEVITWGEDAPRQPPLWDVQMEVMELPYVLRVTAGALEPRTGYLRLPAEVQRAVGETMGARQCPRIGVIWSAGAWNRSRSVPFAELRSLLATEGVEFWSLQGDSEREAWTSLRGAGRRDVYECGSGIVPLAAVIAGMDLVLTVDTLGAHLAGALGVPCWVLLQHRADWRWMCRRTDTPWYPSLRLFRQTATGGWRGLMERIHGELRLWLESRPDALRGLVRTASL